LHIQKPWQQNNWVVTNKHYKNKMKIKHPHKKPRITEVSKRKALEKVAIVSHLIELRIRLLYIVGSILVIALLIFFVQEQVTSLLFIPVHKLPFNFVSPSTGAGFLFILCSCAGLILSVPYIMYEILEYIAPMIRKDAQQLIIRSSYYSAGLVILGFCFAYFIGLPLIMHFLASDYDYNRLHAIFTAQNYSFFVVFYLGATILFFQIPLVMLLINKLEKPPTTEFIETGLFIISASVVVAMIVQPTTNLASQLVIAFPLLALYQTGLLLVHMQNVRSGLPKKVVEMLKQDQLIQAERLQHLTTAKLVQEYQQNQQVELDPEPATDNSARARLIYRRRERSDYNYF
jgi:sec-independent protein translocase protein TatC